MRFGNVSPSAGDAGILMRIMTTDAKNDQPGRFENL
jgi:hypothetical protein